VQISKLSLLQQKLGHQFQQVPLLSQALTHRSHGTQNNERLEFLGDSILNFLIGEALFQQFPLEREGQMSRLRAQLVREKTLAVIAREFSLGDYLILGEGELKSGGRDRDSILADSLEALIGAIYLDAGLEVCRARVLDWYADRLSASALDTSAKDSKTRLQEYLQSLQQPLPEYRVVEEAGEAHSRLFTVECSISLVKQPARAQASSRREAEKAAAAQLLRALKI
jgi:ribonuclease-3